jgi:hypothetical protein
MPTHQEKRNYPRAAVKWPVVLRTAHGEIGCETVNITVDGALIHCEEPLPPNEDIEIIINVPSLVRPVTLAAQVIHSSISDQGEGVAPCEVGVQFTEVSDKNRWIISAAVQRESGVMLMP